MDEARGHDREQRLRRLDRRPKVRSRQNQKTLVRGALIRWYGGYPVDRIAMELFVRKSTVRKLLRSAGVDVESNPKKGEK